MSDALQWIGADSADPPNPYNPTLTAQLCESPPPPKRPLGIFALQLYWRTDFERGRRQTTWTQRLTNQCAPHPLSSLRSSSLMTDDSYAGAAVSR